MRLSKVEFLDDYQVYANEFAIYPKESALEYLITGLCSEAGEAAGKVAKTFRGDKELNLDDFISELGDVLWFVSELAEHFDVSLEEVATRNINKLADRKERNVIKGDGDVR